MTPLRTPTPHPASSRHPDAAWPSAAQRTPSADPTPAPTAAVRTGGWWGAAYRAVVAVQVALLLAPGLRWGRRDRGDVPGWVLITVMTAGLVSMLWIFAGPALLEMFKNALASVTGRK